MKGKINSDIEDIHLNSKVINISQEECMKRSKAKARSNKTCRVVRAHHAAKIRRSN